MRWSAVLLFAIGCRYPDPGFNLPSDDQPPDDADIDDGDDVLPDDDTGPYMCSEPASIDGMVQLPGKMVAGFSPAEDESFALSWLAGMNLGYTEGNLGESYSPTDIPNVIARAHLSPDNNTVYFFDTNGPSGMRMRRATRTGTPGEWTTPIWSGMSEGFPGRPTLDDQRMFYDQDLIPTEAVRMGGGVWIDVRSYTAEDFGNETASVITSGNLSPDGAFLLYTLGGPNELGIYLRVRVNGSFDVDDGAYGIMLQAGPYRDAVFTERCSHLFVYNTTTSQVERWDVH